MMKPLNIFLISALFLSACTTRHPKVAETPVAKRPFIVKPQEIEQFNPHGSVFEIERIQDTLIPKVGAVATFRCSARNFVPGQSVLLVRQTLSGQLTPVFEYQVDDDGTLGRPYSEGTMVLENDLLLMFDFFRAESIRYWLVTTDGKTRIGRLVVPYPIIAQGMDDVQISLRRLTPDARLVLCEGDGFLPDEIVYVTSRTGKNVTANIGYSCKNGKFSMVFEPAISGGTGGSAYIEVKRAHERLALEYDWGCEAVSQKKRIASPAKMDRNTLTKLSEES